MKPDANAPKDAGLALGDFIGTNTDTDIDVKKHDVGDKAKRHRSTWYVSCCFFQYSMMVLNI